MSDTGASGADAIDELGRDDALLESVDAGAPEGLRLWEPLSPCVVLGRSSDADDQVDPAACAARGVPIVRRASGGGAVLLAPGCLVYAVALRLTGARQSVEATVDEVVQRHARALSGRLGVAVEIAGGSDLAVDGRKVSGNAQRRRRHAALVHGTLLYAMDLSLADALLARPPRPPEYRAGRGHSAFMGNLPASRDDLESALRAAWDPVLSRAPQP